MQSVSRDRVRSLVVTACLVAFGGFTGATARYVLGAVSGEALLVTILVNVSGSFCLGLLIIVGRSESTSSNRARLLLGTGFLASFTTYSTFIADISLAEPLVGIGYLSATYVGGFLAVGLSSWFVTKTEEVMPG